MLKLHSEDGPADQDTGVSDAWPVSIESLNHREQSPAPSRGDAYNLDLSKRRVAAVKQALVDRFQIRRDRLLTDGFGMRRRVDRNDTLEGRARNRRVELSRDGKVRISKNRRLGFTAEVEVDMGARGK